MGSPLRVGAEAGSQGFTKMGITYGDHHLKDKEGAYQSSPPKELKVLYDYLPTEREKPEKGIPTKLVLQGEINSLKSQSVACGVYSLVHGEARPWKSTKGEQKEKYEGGKPMWKHALEDYVITADKIGGEDGWVVSKFTTLNCKKMSCMRLVGTTPPYDPKAGTWQEWDGRDWIAAPTVKCRATYHGWGLDKLDKSRLTHSTGSPDGAH